MSKKTHFLNLNLFICLIFSLMPITCLSATSGIQNLGVLSGDIFSAANGVSGDGKTVVGVSYVNNPNFGRAFVWTDAMSLQFLGGFSPSTIGNALGVNQTGSVIVGTASAGKTQAFVWTASTGLVNISPNVNQDSVANAVNANATNLSNAVAVGRATFIGPSRAFRWTNATGAVPLGLIPPAVIGNSEAFGVSADGNVVVGQSNTVTFDLHAFRWENNVMIDLGTLPGGDNSLARGVSSNGNIIVGTSNDLNGVNQAVIWTATVIESLGIFPSGTFTEGNAINANGTVVVGNGDTGTGLCGFRWTRTTGLQTIEQWLAAAGISTAGSPTAKTATSVSSDGLTIVGTLDNGMAYIARIGTSNSGSGSGIVAIPDLYQSLNSTTSALTLAQNSTGLVIHGSHGHPLDNRIYEGCNGFWMTGDWGYFRNRKPNDQRGPTALAELGFSHLFNDYFQGGVGAGRTSSTQHLISNSRIVVNGTYFIAETITKLPCDLWATLTGYYLFGKEKIQRGYTFGGVTNSAGNPSVTTPAARARLDWENAACFHQLALSPYADLSYVRVKLNAYTEHLGSFPSFFARRHDHSTEARVGINSSLGLGCLNLLGTIEGVHHFERTGTAANGQVLGLFAFNLPGQKVPQNWVRGSLGFKQPFMYGVFTVYLNGATRGLDPRVWAVVNYNLSF